MDCEFQTYAEWFEALKASLTRSAKLLEGTMIPSGSGPSLPFYDAVQSINVALATIEWFEGHPVRMGELTRV